MLTLKFLISSILFLVTGGAVFAEKFKHYRAMVIVAGGVAIIGSIYLFDDIFSSVSNYFNNSSTTKNNDSQVDLHNFKVDADGFGLVQIGMSLSDAYASLGLSKYNPKDLSGFSVSDSSCVPISPEQGKIGIEFLLVQGRIARIDIKSPKIETKNGLRIGSTINELRERFQNIKVVPHKYIEKAYYYIVKMDYTKNEYVFEVKDDKVLEYRVGELPAVEWVERCL